MSNVVGVFSFDEAKRNALVLIMIARRKRQRYLPCELWTNLVLTRDYFPTYYFYAGLHAQCVQRLNTEKDDFLIATHSSENGMWHASIYGDHAGSDLLRTLDLERVKRKEAASEWQAICDAESRDNDVLEYVLQEKTCTEFKKILYFLKTSGIEIHPKFIEPDHDNSYGLYL